MAFKSGINRSQTFLTSFDDFIPSDHIARVIDAFVNTLDLSLFKYSSPKSTGNRPYSPATLLKVYLLGYHLNIRSSRKLENALLFDLQFIWISHGCKIKHSAIADFRKDNHHLLKPIMLKFNLSLKNFDLFSNVDSTDGTKVKAVNSKDNNFTLNKLDSRIDRLKKHIDEFDALFDKEDDIDTLQSILDNAINCYNSKQKFEHLKNDLEKNNKSQVSLIDPDAKLMPNNGKFEVCYNDQVCVDTKSHLVKDFQVSSNPADVGSLSAISKEVKEIYGQNITTNITDKGYYSSPDMVECLENGIIPEVTPNKGQDSFVLETEYEDNVITEEMKNSVDNKDIKKCLRAGVIPDVYKDKIKDIEIIEKTIYENVVDILEDDNTSNEDKRDFAMENNCFVRNIKENKVFCPMGEILRQKSTNNDKTRYYNKLACKNCKNPCCFSKFKTVDFKKGQIIYGKNTTKKVNKRNKKKIKKVKFTLICNFELLKQRMATSEHPHGSMKFWDNSRYLLLKGINKVTGELALYYCAFNIRRAVNLLGAEALIKHFEAIKASFLDNIQLFFMNFLYFS